MSPVESPELSSGSLDVLVDGSLGDTENFTDLPGALAFCDRGQNFTLTRRQRRASRLGLVQGHGPRFGASFRPDTGN